MRAIEPHQDSTWLWALIFPRADFAIMPVLFLVGLAALDLVRYGLAVDLTMRCGCSMPLSQPIRQHRVASPCATGHPLRPNDAGARETSAGSCNSTPQFPAARNELLQLLISQKHWSKHTNLPLHCCKIARGCGTPHQQWRPCQQAGYARGSNRKLAKSTNSRSKPATCTCTSPTNSSRRACYTAAFRTTFFSR